MTKYLGELEVIEIRDEQGRRYRGTNIVLLEAALDAVHTLDELEAQIQILNNMTEVTA